MRVAGFLNLARRLLALLAMAVVAQLLASPAAAQTVSTFTNNTTSNITGTTTCAAPVVRTFNVTTAFTVGDVDLGIYATHTWRGDIRVTLQAPDGTRVQLINGDTNAISGDNLNVHLNDGATQEVNTDSATGNHAATLPPPFANTFRPNSPLAAFNGKSSLGNWRVEVCDLFSGADNGVLRYVALYLSTVAPNTIDLSLDNAISNAAPTLGQTVTYTLTVNSASYSTRTTDLTVAALLPTGVSYVSHSGDGTYVPGTGVWSVTGLAPNGTRTLSIVATVTASAGASITFAPEIASAGFADIDSTPGNAGPSEDDYDPATFTVAGTRTAGIAPTLTCPAGFINFDWTGRSWPAGSTANNYTLDGFGAFNWAISNPGIWMNDAGIGGLQPALTTSAQGVLSLSKGIDFANRSQVAVTTITLGAVVDGAQFTVFDVDYAANDFADWIRVTGRRGTTVVIPVLTNGVSNYVIGNEAFGDAGSAAASANGNVVVTFDQPVDQIVIEYGNHALAPADPDGQAVQMAGGISVCTPVADLVVTKSSTVLSDPVRGAAAGAMAIPGALLRYCITIRNDGSATASNVAATDILPASVAFQTGTIQSGTSCASTPTVEDDDASDGAETDSVQASFGTGQVNVAISSIAANEVVAIAFEAQVN